MVPQPGARYAFRSGLLEWEVYVVAPRVTIAVPYRLKSYADGTISYRSTDRVIGPAIVKYETLDPIQ